MADPTWERVDPLINRWKKFTTNEDAVRLAAVEHSPTSELQRLVKELDEVKSEVASAIKGLEEKYGVSETGDIGLDTTPEPEESRRHQALIALRHASEEATEEIADRELGGEA